MNFVFPAVRRGSPERASHSFIAPQTAAGGYEQFWPSYYSDPAASVDAGMHDPTIPLDNFGMIGYVIIGVFAASWLISAAVYRWKRFDELET